MSSKGSAHVELETVEVEKLRIVVQQLIGEGVLLDAMRSMLVEVKRDNGRSEFGSAEGSAAVGESPEGAGPTALGQGRVQGQGLLLYERRFLRDGGLRNFGETRHGEAAVPVEVDPETDQPDQPGRHGTWHFATAPAARRLSGLCESDVTDFLETGRRDRTLGMPCTPVVVQVAATGKVEATATEKADVGESTDGAVEAPARSAVALPRLSMAMEATPKPPKVVPQ